jgi:hypothetical protein
VNESVQSVAEPETVIEGDSVKKITLAVALTRLLSQVVVGS